MSSPVTQTVPLPLPTDVDGDGYELWVIAVTQQLVKILQDLGPSVYQSSGAITVTREVQSDTIQAEILNAECEYGGGDNMVRATTRVSVIDRWDTEDSGSWQRIWYTITTEPTKNGRATCLTVEQES